MPLEVNAQFNQFVQFAQDQANPATSKAIARMGAEGPLASERRRVRSSPSRRPRATPSPAA